MIHPDTQLQFIDDVVGYGVVATKKIPKGTITWVLDKFDREFTPEEAANYEPMYQEILTKYTYRNQLGNLVLCWDFGRFVNHSFRSNCISTAYDFEIAVRDIEIGEELTNDYGYLNISIPFQPKDENTLRKTVFPDDVLKYHSEWDKQVMDSLPFFTKVDQPLEVLMPNNIVEEMHDIIKGNKILRSIIENYFHDPQM
ncbi:MAG: SET domain-containing protein [Saprospiraceae bacterium]